LNEMKWCNNLHSFEETILVNFWHYKQASRYALTTRTLLALALPIPLLYLKFSYNIYKKQNALNTRLIKFYILYFVSRTFTVCLNLHTGSWTWLATKRDWPGNKTRPALLLLAPTKQ
jgi:hypothetical protein